MQWEKRKVPCGGSSALCKGARASLWPAGLHVQPLWALLLQPVWWERPDPLGNQPKAALSCVTQSQGRQGGQLCSQPQCKVWGGRRLERPAGTAGSRSALPPSRGALVEQPEAGRGRRERAQSSIASSWSARSSNMLLMSSKMFLAECMVPGWLGRKGRESKHCSKAAATDGEGLARLGLTQQQELSAELGLSMCDPCGAGMTCPRTALPLPSLEPSQPHLEGLGPSISLTSLPPPL